MERLFLVRDETGHSTSAMQFTAAKLLANGWDFTYTNDPGDEWEDNLGAWIHNCEVGDEYKHTEEQATLIRVS